MSKKKKSLDLTKLVREEQIQNGEKFYFVSDPAKWFIVAKQPNNEYKIQTPEGVTTIHAYAQACLGSEPPTHASHWFKNDKGKTLYEIWHANDDADEYAA